MPELPEVETIKSQLQKILPCKIVSISKGIHFKTLLKNDYIKIENKKIISIFRFGKTLIFEFENCFLHSGLGMTGSWFISEDNLKDKHLHFQIKIQNEKNKISYLSYVDPRRFGRMNFYSRIDHLKKIKESGIDPSSNKFTVKYLTIALNSYPNRIIKNAFLDQKLFPGIGNYMASEICAIAKILPTRNNGSLNKKEIQSLFIAFKTVLDNSIKTGGTTFQGGYKDALGNKGKGVKNLIVFYQENCQRCKKTKVEKIYLNKRGTYYCPFCQK